MRALLITAPGRAEVRDVPAPRARGGEVVVEVERAGICGTDAELFRGTMSYIRDGHTTFPIRPGHEWCGRVRSVGAGVDPAWVGRRVTADTMLGCRHCRRCRSDRHHLCATRTEIGVRGDRPGALAERLAVPAWALHAIPEVLSAAAGALVEPGGTALRAVRAAGLTGGEGLLVLGGGTIGLLCAAFGAVHGAHVTVADPRPEALALAERYGAGAVSLEDLPPGPAFEAVIDASGAAEGPRRAVELTEPGGRLVLVGLAGRPALVDSRDLVLGDLSVHGLLGASAGLDGAIAWYAAGEVVPDDLVGAVVGLDEAPGLLAGARPAGATPGPKMQVQPSRHG